ncbi:Mitochondrial outer membrane import complex protein METAXIN [Linum perenne]
MEESRDGDWTLVARKPYFGLPTACPVCLPLYIYLKFARFPFNLEFNSAYPDSGLLSHRLFSVFSFRLASRYQIPYIEAGTYVAYNNEKGGVIQYMKQDGVVDLDAEFSSDPEWVSMKAMISSWLADAITYELWIGSADSSSMKIYYSDLPWVIGKGLFVKQVYDVKQQLHITKQNVEQRESELFDRAKNAYRALSTKLGEHDFLFESRPTSLDADLVAHVLFTVQALPEESVLRTALLEHGNLIRYAEKHNNDLLKSGPSSASLPQFPSPASSQASSSSKSKRKPKREQTEEEKAFKRKAKYFLGAQLVAVLLFLSLLGSSGASDMGIDEDDEDYE